MITFPKIPLKRGRTFVMKEKKGREGTNGIKKFSLKPKKKKKKKILYQTLSLPSKKTFRKSKFQLRKRNKQV